MAYRPEVDIEKGVGCGECVEVCEHEAITIIES